MSNQAENNQSLGATARWTASARAQESARDDHIFYDPWAAALAGEQGAEWLTQRSGNVSPMIIRTRYFDDFLQRAAAEHAVRQIVLGAAGLDTRAYRLDWPEGTRLFELDQPAVLQYKAEVLQSVGARPACQRQAVPVDLTTGWGQQITACGFDPTQPSAWLWEGILFYLPNESIIQILDTVSSLSAPGSWLGFDIVNNVTLTSPLTRAWIEMQAQMGAPWIGTMEDPEAFLAGRGWKASLTQPGSPDASYGRWTLPVVPVKLPNFPHNWYVTAVKERPGKG